MKKSIWFVLPTLTGGGAQKVSVLFANELSRRGYEVTLVLCEGQGPNLSLVNNNIKVIDLKKGRVIKSLQPLINLLRKNSPDFLFSSLPHLNFIVALAHFISGSKSKLIQREATTPSAVKRNKFISFHLLKLAYKYCYRVIAPTDTVKQDIIDYLKIKPEKIFRVYNPVLKEKISENSLILYNNDNHSVIVSAGRLVAEKGFSDIIESLALLRNKSVKLRIFGEGDQRERLLQLAKEKNVDLELPGYVSNLVEEFRKADLFVSASKREGFPNVLIEALAAGLPIVSTDCPSGPKELLADGIYGMLVPMYDISSLSNAIEKQLTVDRSDTYKSAVIRANQFTVDAAVDTLENIVLS
ncbi:MAG: glycosyltransferase [Bacteroidia bacterium]